MDHELKERWLERWIAVGAALVALVLLACVWRVWNNRFDGIAPKTERKMMPSLVLSQLDGEVWRMEEHRGQVVLVNYWATWCGPCLDETPELVRLSRELGPKGFSIVGISVDDGSKDEVRRFVKRFEISYPVVFYGPSSQMAQGMSGLPTSILIDRQGKVAKTYVGEVDEEGVRHDVETLLKEAR